MDETLTQPAAQAQPGAEQAVSQPAAEPGTIESPATTPTGVEPAGISEVPGRLYAGKYASAEELERAYLNAQSEGSRMAQDLARLRGRDEVRSATPDVENPAARYSTDQLESFKEGHLLQIPRYQQAGDEAKAGESASAIRMIDRELRRRDVAMVTQQFTQQNSLSALSGVGDQVLQAYQAELTPGTPLAMKASELYDQYVQAGAPAGRITAANAVAVAAQLLGKTATTAGAQAARKELTDSIRSSMKQAVTTGAGKAAAVTSGTTGDQLMSMNDQEFIKWAMVNIPNYSPPGR